MVPAARPSEPGSPRDPGGGMVRTAVIPVAGLGTRLLPATKAIPKGMLPVIDKPTAQYITEEAAAAGLTDIVLVTGPGQDAFRNYFGPGAQLTFLTQDEPRGLGDAVLRCASHIGTQPFALLLGDNILTPGSNLLTAMIETRQQHGGTIVALAPADPRDPAARYPVTSEPTGHTDVVRVTGLASTPDPAAASSGWIMIGRLVCDPAIFAVLRNTPPGHDGEIQLSDALNALARTSPAAGGGVHGVLYPGHRLDTGTTQHYLRTTIELACTRPDTGPDFLPWLRHYLHTTCRPIPGANPRNARTAEPEPGNF